MSRKLLLKLVTSFSFLTVAPHLSQAQQPPTSLDAGMAVSEAAPSIVRPRLSPPKAPHVTCQGGQLTIVAENSTMSSIFTAVRACIGVEIQVPRNFDDDRSFVTLGPGSVRAVLDEFFSGTDFNYVMQSSLSDAREIQSIQLTERTKDARDGRDSLGAANLTMTPARRAWLASRNAGRPAPSSDENDSDAQGEQARSAGSDGSSSAPVDSNLVAPTSPATNEPKDLSEDQKKEQSRDQPPDAQGTTSTSLTGPALGPGTVATPTQTPDASDASQSAPEPSVLQKQINQMEQLFEQRKQMNVKPAPAPTQPPDPNQN